MSSSSHNITKFKRIGNNRCSNKSTYMSHIHQQKSTNCICNLPTKNRCDQLLAQEKKLNLDLYILMKFLYFAGNINYLNRHDQ